MKLQRFREGQIIECSPEEFESWLRVLAERYEIRSSSEAAVIGLASRAVSELVAARAVNLSVDTHVQELKGLLKESYDRLPSDRKGTHRCVDYDPAGSTYEFTESDWSKRTREILGYENEPSGI